MNILAIARVTIAVVALALILVPGELWSAPESDYHQHGFDKNLVYTAPANAFVFDPFVVVQKNTGQPCPCTPGTELTISGSGFALFRAVSDSGELNLDGLQVLVEGSPALLHLTTPSQIDFELPQSITGTSAAIEVLRDGRSIGRDSVAVGGGPAASSVIATGEQIQLRALDGGEPAVTLLTTPLSFAATVTASVEQTSADAVPLRLMLWNPRNFSSLDLVFGADGEIRVAFRERPGVDARTEQLMRYDPHTPYEVTFRWESGKNAAISLAAAGESHQFELAAAEAPALLDAYRPSLTASAAARGGASAASLSGYDLQLLPERFTTIRIDDPIVPPLMLALTALGLALLVVSLSPQRAFRALRRALGGAFASARRAAHTHPVAYATGGAFVLAYVALNGALFSLGSHPFDMSSQGAWSYIASTYGIADLYYVSQTATLAGVWNGVPYHEAVFPYNAAMSYYFWTIGHTHHVIFGDGPPDSMSMQVVVKSFNLAFLLADAALVVAIVRHLRPGSRYLPWMLGAALLLNPAVIFDTAIWGETESVVLFPLFASLLAALKDRPGLAWPLLAVAFLTKQTVLLPVLGIAVWYVLRFDLRRNLEGFSAAMVTVLCVTLPFTLSGYPPSIAIDPALAGVWTHGAGGAERAFQVVSYDAFNVWTLVTAVVSGASGLARFQQPDYEPRVGSLSYHEIGLIGLALSIGFLLAFWRMRRAAAAASVDAALLGIALIFLLELFLPTQTLSRYYIFVIAFVTLALAGRSPLAAGFALGAISLTALVGQWGSMALVLQEFPGHAPHLAPQHDGLSRAMASLFTADAFITIAVLLNGLALASLAVACWRSAASAAPEPLPPITATQAGLQVTFAPAAHQQ